MSKPIDYEYRTPRVKRGDFYMKIQTSAGSWSIHCPKDMQTPSNTALFKKFEKALIRIYKNHPPAASESPAL